MSKLIQNLKQIQSRISQACSDANRPESDVQLIWVSKNNPIEAVIEARKVGANHFGENRVQEALKKFEEKPNDETLHIIGPVQSNKLRKAVQISNWIHTIDSNSKLQKLQRICEEEGKELNVLFQVNTSGESTKSGIPKEELEYFLKSVQACSNLKYRGLMAIPSASVEEEVRAEFASLNKVLNSFKGSSEVFADFDQLSMGMSGDLEWAIAEGATFIRVGTALFGQRDYSI
jgi:pyridoxal phosphate enzyme (YggS family)